MPYGHLISATVMTFGVCQDYSSIASLSTLTNLSCGPSATAELLVIQYRNVTERHDHGIYCARVPGQNGDKPKRRKSMYVRIMTLALILQ